MKDKAGVYDILSALCKDEKTFNELAKNISRQTLSTRLKELEEAGYVLREVLSTRPPRTRYKLTTKGKAFFAELVTKYAPRYVEDFLLWHKEVFLKDFSKELLGAVQAFRPIIFDLLLYSCVHDASATVSKWGTQFEEEGWVSLNKYIRENAKNSCNIYTGEWGPLRDPEALKSFIDATNRGINITIFGHISDSFKQPTFKDIKEPTFEDIKNFIFEKNEKNRSTNLELFDRLKDSPNFHLHVREKNIPDIYHFITIDASNLYLQEPHAYHGEPKRTAFIKNAGELAESHDQLFEKLLRDPNAILVKS